MFLRLFYTKITPFTQVLHRYYTKSQKNTCPKVSFLIKLQALGILIKEHLWWLLLTMPRNQANLDRTRKIWYLFSRNFWTLVPKPYFCKGDMNYCCTRCESDLYQNSEMLFYFMSMIAWNFFFPFKYLIMIQKLSIFLLITKVQWKKHHQLLLKIF